MNDFGAILFHFLRGVFNVAAGASSAGRVSRQLDGFAAISAERPFTIPEGSETFSPRAPVVPVTDDDSDPDWFIHECLHDGNFM